MQSTVDFVIYFHFLKVYITRVRHTIISRFISRLDEMSPGKHFNLRQHHKFCQVFSDCVLLQRKFNIFESILEQLTVLAKTSSTATLLVKIVVCNSLRLPSFYKDISLRQNLITILIITFSSK